MKPVRFYLIRGLTRESVHWGGFPEKLKAMDFVKEVVCLDLPGTGSFYELKSPLKVSEYADFLLSKIHEIQGDKKEPKVILSISLGSMVAVEMVRKRVGEFDKIYLINTSFSDFSPFYRRLLLRAYWRFFRIAIATNPRKKEQEILKMISNNPSIWPSLLDSFSQAAIKRPLKIQNFLRQLTAATFYSVGKKRPEGSFILLNSKGDRMVHHRCSEAIASHWQVPLYTHPSAGHDLPTDDPQWVLDILSKTVKTIRAK